MDSKYDKIRPYHDAEVNDALRAILDDPMLKAIMNFTFPTQSDDEWKSQLLSLNSIDAFQKNIVYHTLVRVLAISSDGLTTSGFDKLDPNQSYLFISNHRDIILDTSLINFTLADYGHVLTASAIGDNLVRKSFLHSLAKLNRNFLVLRDLAPRELLEASMLLSAYIQEMLQGGRSIWIAQREGRTKDGNDATHPGVLKMLHLADNSNDLLAYFKNCRIVSVSISYEYDPTDKLKLPELIANLNNEPYVKAENEDFNSIYRGITGQKRRIHIHASDVLDAQLDDLLAQPNNNKQIKMLAQIIDNQIIGNYKLWPSNYIAYDMLYHTDEYQTMYSEAEKTVFQERLQTKIDVKNKVILHQFLGMYANPLVNKKQLENPENV